MNETLKFKVIDGYKVIAFLGEKGHEFLTAETSQTAEIISEWLNDYIQFADSDQLDRMIQVCEFE